MVQNSISDSSHFSFKILKPKALAFVELQFCFLCYLVFSFCRMLISIDRDEKLILSSPLLHTWNMQGAFIEISGRESTFWIYFLGTGFWLGLTGFWCGKRIYLQLVLTEFCIDLYLHIPTYQSYKWFAFVALCFRHLEKMGCFPFVEDAKVR